VKSHKFGNAHLRRASEKAYQIIIKYEDSKRAIFIENYFDLLQEDGGRPPFLAQPPEHDVAVPQADHIVNEVHREPPCHRDNHEFGKRQLQPSEQDIMRVGVERH
jgi:hypothetical protein